jgi:hypothetical protein
MTTLEEISAHLRAHRGFDPAWFAPGDAVTDAWKMCSDAAPMIEFLLAASSIGVFEADSPQHWTDADGKPLRWLFRLQVGKKYFRIDVNAADGAEGVRRCLPDLPSGPELVGLMQQRNDSLPLLQRLANDLMAGKAPTDRVAIEAGWAACDDDPFVMSRLLYLLGADVSSIVWPRGDGGLTVSPRLRRESCEAIRRVFPVLPIRWR